MEVPIFSGGDPSEFRCFATQKFFIVKFRLRGQPKKDILGFEHDVQPFTRAMSTLQKLYGDIGILIQTKIEQIISWPKLAVLLRGRLN